METFIEEKGESFAGVAAEAARCRLCPAMLGRTAVLSCNNGRVWARVMFIGEAPGRQGGDRTRVPLSGDQSGRNFERFIASIDLPRAEIFITNAVLCNPRSQTGANRTPTDAEAANCSYFLRRQIEIIDPPVIATLGRIALAALRRIEYHDFSLREAVGSVHEWNNRLLVPLYHPSPQVLASHRREAAQLCDYQQVARALRRTASTRAQVEPSGFAPKPALYVSMNEAIEQITLQESALEQTLRSAGASLVERDGWRVVASFGDEEFEYAAVRCGPAGLIDLTSRGRIEVSGAEAVQFLNGLVTNDVKALPENQWMPAAFPNVQGRLIAQTRILRRGAHSFLIDTESPSRERVLKTLQRFTLAGDFSVTDRTNDSTLLSVQGARSAEVIGAVLGEDAARTERGHITYAERLGTQGTLTTLIRATHTSEDGFDLFIGAADAPSLWNCLVEAGARPIGFNALDVLRVEAGLPRYGVDMDESNIVLEAGLDEAISYTKGCYIGQEIIARIHWRGHVARRLAGLVFDEDVKTEALSRDAKVRADGKDIGRLTSSVYSPHLNRLIALSYIKYNYLAPGTEVQVVSGESEHRARVAELPFVRGSWAAASPES